MNKTFHINRLEELFHSTHACETSIFSTHTMTPDLISTHLAFELEKCSP